MIPEAVGLGTARSSPLGDHMQLPNRATQQQPVSIGVDVISTARAGSNLSGSGSHRASTQKSSRGHRTVQAHETGQRGELQETT
jgi:hypothetical protein